MSKAAVALRRALARSPASLRALAREAKVSHALLLMIVRGQRAATPVVMTKVATALSRWAANCEHGARMVRRAAKEER